MLKLDLCINIVWIYATGFEAGGPHTPSNIGPWSIIGDDSSIFVATDRTSCFNRNIVALRMEVLCDNCPAGGVGIYNPGFWGMVWLFVDCMFSFSYWHVKWIICHNYLVNISNLYNMLESNVGGLGDFVIHRDIIEFHAFPSEHIYETFIYIFRFTTLVYFFFLFNNATFF